MSGNVWVFVQLIVGPRWPMDQLNKNPNIGQQLCPSSPQRISATVIERVPGCPHGDPRRGRAVISAPVAVALSESPLNNGDNETDNCDYDDEEDEEDEDDFDEDDDLCTPPSSEFDIAVLCWPKSGVRGCASHGFKFTQPFTTFFWLVNESRIGAKSREAA